LSPADASGSPLKPITKRRCQTLRAGRLSGGYPSGTRRAPALVPDGGPVPEERDPGRLVAAGDALPRGL